MVKPENENKFADGYVLLELGNPARVVKNVVQTGSSMFRGLVDGVAQKLELDPVFGENFVVNHKDSTVTIDGKTYIKLSIEEFNNIFKAFGVVDVNIVKKKQITSDLLTTIVVDIAKVLHVKYEMPLDQSLEMVKCSYTMLVGLFNLMPEQLDEASVEVLADKVYKNITENFTGSVNKDGIYTLKRNK